MKWKLFYNKWTRCYRNFFLSKRISVAWEKYDRFMSIGNYEHHSSAGMHVWWPGGKNAPKIHVILWIQEDRTEIFPLFFSLRISWVTCHTCLNTMMSTAPAKASTYILWLSMVWFYQKGWLDIRSRDQNYDRLSTYLLIHLKGNYFDWFPLQTL